MDENRWGLSWKDSQQRALLWHRSCWYAEEAEGNLHFTRPAGTFGTHLIQELFSTVLLFEATCASCTMGSNVSCVTFCLFTKRVTWKTKTKKKQSQYKLGPNKGRWAHFNFKLHFFFFFFFASTGWSDESHSKWVNQFFPVILVQFLEQAFLQPALIIRVVTVIPRPRVGGIKPYFDEKQLLWIYLNSCINSKSQSLSDPQNLWICLNSC